MSAPRGFQNVVGLRRVGVDGSAGKRYSVRHLRAPSPVARLRFRVLRRALITLSMAAAALVPRAAAQAPAPSPAPTPRPATLEGLVELVGRDGQARPAEGAVVWVLGAAARQTSAEPRMASQEKRFAPHVIAVRRGATVSFPNHDRIYHNVFSRSTGNEFDLGLYRKGASRSVTFRKPGLVNVYCNIHPDMAAYVMVLGDAAFTVTAADGRYRLEDLPAGRRTVRVWVERGGERQQAVDLAPGATQELAFRIDASGWRRVQHKNKYGRDYPPVTRDVDRY
jgi:plastocyanin